MRGEWRRRQYDILDNILCFRADCSALNVSEEIGEDDVAGAQQSADLYEKAEAADVGDCAAKKREWSSDE